MKVSFDFDSTLDTEEVQTAAKALIKRGFEIHIVTSRYSDEANPGKNWNKDLWLVVNYLGIDEQNVHFMGFVPKYVFFKSNPDFAFHIDDDYEEIVDIDRNTEVIGIHYPIANGWRKMINNAIEIET